MAHLFMKTFIKNDEPQHNGVVINDSALLPIASLVDELFEHIAENLAETLSEDQMETLIRFSSDFYGNMIPMEPIDDPQTYQEVVTRKQGPVDVCHRIINLDVVEEEA